MRGLLLGSLLLTSFGRGEDSWVRHVVADNFQTTTAVAIDFNGDGRIDIIANESARKEDTLFTAPEWKPTVLHKGYSPIHSVAADVDGNGRLDYVGAQYMPGIVYAITKSGTPPRVLTSELSGIHGLAVGDVNGDGKADIAANSAQPDGKHGESIAWLKAPEWTVEIAGNHDAPGLSHYMGIGDVNGDGRADIGSGAKVGNWFAVWLQGPAKWTKQVIAENQVGATHLLPADVNHDGRMDLIASRGHGKGLLWFEGPSWKAHDINTEIEYPHSVDIADIDRDGDVDVVACTAYYSEDPPKTRLLAWFENDGKGTFRTHRMHENQASYDVKLVDIDGDRDLDVLVAGQESKNVVWYENRLPGKK